MSHSRRRNQVLRKQARYMIYDVYCYMAKEAEEGVRNVKQIQQRTAEATLTSVRAVSRIVKEVKSSDNLTKTPGKKRFTPKRITGIDNLDLGSIRRFIHTFHLVYNEYPTVNKLLINLQSNFNFQGSESSARRVVKDLGFTWKRINDHNRILIENWDLRLKRILYLNRLKKYYQDGRTIVYSDELYLGRSLAQNKAKNKQPVIVVYACSEAGFIPNSFLITHSHDNKGNLSYDTYQNWLQHQLIPNLPPKSVVIVDNSSPHDMESDPPPHCNAKNCDMQDWLTKKKIDYTLDMSKPQLYQLIKRNKERFKEYALDKRLAEYNHDILRLPPHHPDLNPLESVWTTLKSHVNSNIKEFNVNKVIDLVKEKVAKITLEEWKMYCQNVNKIEDIYRKNEEIIDTLSENIVEEMDSSSESENSNSSSEENT